MDTEFTSLPWTGHSELLWIALVDETGEREFSAVNADCSLDDCSAFVREHVLPRLTGAEISLPNDALARAVADFITGMPCFWAWMPSPEDLAGFGDPELAQTRWKAFADWDYQLLRRLLDPIPQAWQCRDLHALATATGVPLPPNPNAHHPLADAHWARQLWLAATDRSAPSPR